MRNHAIHALIFAAALLLIPGISAQIPTAVEKVNITPPNYKVPQLLEVSNDTLAATQVTLIDLIRVEYDYPPDRIFGLTQDQRDTRFDVAAKIDPPGVANPEHDPHARKFLIHALLRNCFSLVAHEAQVDVTFEQLIAIPNATKPIPCLPRRHRSTDAGNHPTTECMTTSSVAARLSHTLHVEVDDRANLPTAFAMDLNWSSDPIPFPKNPGDQPQLPHGLETALQNVGLTLIPSRKREPVLIIDSAGFPAIIEATKASSDGQ